MGPLASGSFGRVEVASQDEVDKVVSLVDSVCSEVRHNNVREAVLYAARLVGDPGSAVSVTDCGRTCRIRMPRYQTTIADLARKSTPGQRLLAFDAVLEGAAEALAELHRAGVVHNDVKPENVMLTRDGQVRLVDFGSCTLAGRSAPLGFTCSTFPYAPPEAFVISTRDETRPARDAYMLGATMLAFLNGGGLPATLREAHRGAPREVEAAMRHYGRLHFHTDALRAEALIDDVRRAAYADGAAERAFLAVAGLMRTSPNLRTAIERLASRRRRPATPDPPAPDPPAPDPPAPDPPAPTLDAMIAGARLALAAGPATPRPEVLGRVGALAHHLLRQYLLAAAASGGGAGDASVPDACVLLAASVLVEQPMRCTPATRRGLAAFMRAVPRPDLGSPDWRLVVAHGLRYEEIDFHELSAALADPSPSSSSAAGQMASYFSRCLEKVSGQRQYEVLTP